MALSTAHTSARVKQYRAQQSPLIYY